MDEEEVIIKPPSPYEIKNYNASSTQRKHKIDPVLGSLDKGGWVLVMVGARGSGKTNLLLNLVNENRFLAREFHYNHRILFSKSLGADPSADKLNCKYKFDDFKPEIIESIMRQQTQIKEDNGKSAMPSVLVILDDFATEKALTEHGILEKLAVRGRHFNITTIITTQKFSAVARTIRLNTDIAYIYEPKSGSEVDFIIETYASKQNRKAFFNMFEYATSNQYDFLHVNFTKPKKERYMRNFDELLNVNDFKEDFKKILGKKAININ